MEENEYFKMDLKMPDLKLDIQTNKSKEEQKETYKFGFVRLLEEIHGKDLKSCNPWLNPKISPRRKTNKRVRFKTTELTSPILPHCRRKTNDEYIPEGQLHANSCINSSQETVNIIGEQAWHSRVFLINNYIIRAHKNELYNNFDERDTETTEIITDMKNKDDMKMI